MADHERAPVAKSFAERLLDESPDALIALTLEGRISRVRGIEAGTDDFLSKPVNKAELLKRVDNMLKLRHVTDEVERLRQYIEQMESRG